MPWTWVRATCRGTSHIAADLPCQDFARCLTIGRDSSILAALVSDGAGSAEFGREGALITCRAIIEGARDHYRMTSAQPTDPIVWSWIDRARDSIALSASRQDTDRREFAATLVCVLAADCETLVLHIGDGAAVLKINDEWSVPSWPENGEFASTTYFITDDPEPRLRITRVMGGANTIAVFSDGIERLALNFVEHRAHEPFFTAMIRPVLLGGPGMNATLAGALASYLGSAAVNDRTDDDKSLILAARI